MSVKPSDAKDIMDLLMGVRDQNKNARNEEKPLDAFSILNLPARLRKTAVVLHRLGRATGAMIASVTGSNVDLECANLEELVKMGYLGTEKKGGKPLFFILT